MKTYAVFWHPFGTLGVALFAMAGELMAAHGVRGSFDWKTFASERLAALRMTNRKQIKGRGQVSAPI